MILRVMHWLTGSAVAIFHDLFTQASYGALRLRPRPPTTLLHSIPTHGGAHSYFILFSTGVHDVASVLLAQTRAYNNKLS